ncbi:MAG: bifunctional folylpolyglutamate synthase/dihydrofolate synthase [Gemmataceae bacterium]|nr:bifunctional folylpolyglutamate synthase/dihydrofolate synthase [Gemmataceae bacterium]MCI0743251.1 bifunctional folylpolyglutamate synthase/dihydrofolate synthase [Gemmataceae bacterium]
MTYEQALQFWFGRVNFEVKSPKASDLKLDRMRALLARLGDPHERLRIVHVAGSKGKGSTSAMLASILRQAGFRTGLFTSPHLEHVEERVQVDGVSIARAELAERMAQIARAARSGDDPLEPTLTFFEIATALGFLHFVDQQVDMAVLEVGLGGRFDSTNVCRPLCAVLTSISFDHTQQLGETLVKIAGEKAGIIKTGVPALSGVRSSEARAVIEETCRLRNAPLREIERDFSFLYQPARINGEPYSASKVRVRTWRGDWPEMELGLIGEHQARNAAVATAIVEVLREQGLTISTEAVAAGLAGVQWPARLEIVGRRPLVVLDCAHNVASAEALVRALDTSFALRPGGRRLLVFAGNKDKDLAGMLEVLMPNFYHVFLTRFTNSPRSVPPEDLAALLEEMGVANRATICPDAAGCWETVRGFAHTDDLICITGSVFLAGQMRPLLVGDQ